MRRLVVGEAIWLWSVRHKHAECREILSLHHEEAGVTLRIVFRTGPDRFVAEGLWYSGSVSDGRGGLLNLHEPGVVRMLLDEAAAHGAVVNVRGETQIDGWPLFDVLVARR